MGRKSEKRNKSHNSSKSTPVKNVNSKGKIKKNEGKDNRKKIWSFDDLVERMKPTCEELDYRSGKSTELNPVETYGKLFKCTKCHKNLKSFIVQNKKAPIHPCLGVLMCEKCISYYKDGEFSLDSDGEDKYCRWCGEGGTLFACSNCICGFCANCIKQHFSMKFFKNVQEDENWLCFFCDPKPLWDQRYICSLAVQLSEENNVATASTQQINESKPSGTSIKKPEEKEPPSSEEEEENNLNSDIVTKRKKHSYRISSSSDETESDLPKTPPKKIKLASTPFKNVNKNIENNKNVETNILPELIKLIKLSEYQMGFGVTWCSETLKKLNKPDYKPTKEALTEKCKKTKWFLSVLSTYLVQFANSVDSLEKSLCQDDGLKVSSNFAEKHQSPYTTILQFLGFVNNQVKTFMQKGISFSDILESTVYDDDRVIGIKKKNPITKEKNTPNDDTETLESMEEKENSGDLSRSEGSSEFASDQINENNLIENEGNSPYLTFGETSNSKTADSTQELQKLIAILENA